MIPSSTMLDLAVSPEDFFKAPLKTMKLAPVTEIEIVKVRFFQKSNSL